MLNCRRPVCGTVAQLTSKHNKLRDKLNRHIRDEDFCVAALDIA